MQVCVTGGTGFVGSEVVRQLTAVGHDVRILSRKPKSNRHDSVAPQVTLIPGDISDPESLVEFCAGADAVIHLVGIIAEVGKNTFEQVHAVGTKNVVAAAKAARIKRYVHMSALGTRANAVSEYHKTKWRGEESVRGSGLDYTIFRPSLIYGARDSFTRQFAGIARVSPFIPVIGPGDGTFQPIQVEAVARCFIGALDEPSSIGQTYDLGGTEILSFNDIVDEILHVMGKKRIKLHLPVPLARAMAPVLEFLFGIFHRAPPFNRDQIIMLLENTVGNVQPARELFKVRPTSFREGLKRCLEDNS